MRLDCSSCEHNKTHRSVYPCNVCGGDPETFFGDSVKPMKCCVAACQNQRGKVRGHVIRVTTELGEVTEGYICNPCWNFLRTGQDLYSTLARNGRRKPKSKG